MIRIYKKNRPDIEEALEKNHMFCPCAIQSDPQHLDPDTKCICKAFREMDSGECPCGLYVKEVSHDD